MRMVGPLFLPWLQEVIRDEEVAVIFLKEFWPRIVGGRMAKSTAPLRLRRRTLEIGVSGREWERVLRGDGSALDGQGQWVLEPVSGLPSGLPGGPALAGRSLRRRGVRMIGFPLRSWKHFGLYVCPEWDVIKTS